MHLRSARPGSRGRDEEALFQQSTSRQASSMTSPWRVAVVGGGIVGLSAAVRIAEEVAPGNVHVTVLAEHFSPHTTGDVAAGFFNPYIVHGVSEEKLRSWCLDAFTFYQRLAESADSNELGLAVVPAYILKEEHTPRPLYADAFFHYRDLTERERASFSPKYRYGSYVTSLTIECKKFLPYLMERLESRGGRLMQRRVNSLEELAGEYDVIVNCTGFGAGALVSDPKVHAVRGQTIRVHAPWIKHAIVAGEDFHVIPNIDDVMLGGTKDVADTSLIPDRDIARKIWNGCLQFVPSLKNARVIGHYVGLRPGRNPVRIESEDYVFNGGAGKVPVIHNYGHGGSGITIAWGCAGDVVRLVRESIQERSSGRCETRAKL
ncbi:D-aspartate oxidase-like isoform X1 [Dermacentor variabilis]|uniref:D-aspartate oxidase-like isoform X1 n=2 Tax=Dermacentor variabilis TaxID=34621 RepID=UPI003F5B3837